VSAVETIVGLPFKGIYLLFKLLNFVFKVGDSSFSVQINPFLILPLFVPLMDHFSFFLEGPLFFVKGVGSIISEFITALVLFVAGNSLTQINWIFVVMDGK